MCVSKIKSLKMYKLKFSFALFFLLLMFRANAKHDSTKVKAELSGFINTQLFADSRQIVESREHMLSLYPKKIEYDDSGRDINAQGDLNQLSMTSRIRLKISGPRVLGALPTGLIEGDFTGASNFENNSFRLREAYIQLKWSRIGLLVGQHWHPINTPECRPFTIGLNTGAPFHPFSRHNQIRLSYYIKSHKFTLVGASQRDFVSFGPNGPSSIYLRDAMLPNFHLQYRYKNKRLLFGIGIDYKQLKPYKAIVVNGLEFRSSSLVKGLSGQIFAKLSAKNWIIKSAVLAGNNLTEHIMLGGYYETTIDSLSTEKSWHASPLFSTWIQIGFEHNQWNFNILGAYSKNLPFKTPRQTFGEYYGRNADISYVYRIMPNATFTAGAFQIGCEAEYTIAAYGDNDSFNHFTQIQEVANIRFILSASYFF